MSETEVTVEVFEDLDSIRRALLSKGFAMTGRYLIRDRYYTGLGDVSGLTYGELIGNSFLIRCIDGPAPVKLLMFKKKEIDASGVVVSEEKVKTVLEDPETAAKIFGLAGLNQYCEIRNMSYIYEKANVALAVQDVEGLGIFIELEEDNTMKGLESREKLSRLTAVLKGLGLKLGSDFSCKKVLMLLKKNNAGLKD
ncbi:MAG: CYTH domain-containing protein [Clostridia bacterium]|nr:CYTH domain-containing protein [Clostridia bacterium]